jgi:hypothetical protein
MSAMTTPIQRRVADLESTAFQAERRHDELVTELGLLREQGREHAIAISAALNDGRELRADMREVKATLGEHGRMLRAIVAHLGIEVPTEE